MSKLTKITIWKDLMALLIVLTVVSCIFVFNIQVGFSVFKNIKLINIVLFMFIISTIISVLIIILIIFIIIYKKSKNKEELN